MRFLIDQNLPVILMSWLAADGHDVEHVRVLGMAASPDTEVLKRAREVGAVVVTKDADFAAGLPDVQVVWVRVGNTTNDRLERVWTKAWPQIRSALEAGDGLVEVWP